MAVEPAQLRPSYADELAARLDYWVDEARAGNCAGFGLIVIGPGGLYTTDGWYGADADGFRRIWKHVVEILDAGKT